MGVYTSALGTARTTHPGGPAASLLPTDGARAAELRNHPRHRDVLGEGLTQLLEDMPAGVTRTVETACDHGMGLP